MAGKRPDQHNIAPGEAGATDYKTRPVDADDAARDDQKFSETMESGDGPWQAGQRPTRGRKKSAKSGKSPKSSE